MRLPETVEAFLTYERLARRVAPGTERLYRLYLRGFLDLWQREEWQGRAIEPVMVDAFIEGLARRGCGDEAQRTAFGVLRWFFRWSFERHHLNDNPMKDMRPPIVRDKPRAVLDPRQASRLLAAIRAAGGLHSRRDHALFSTLYFSGLRIAEAVSLRVEDLDLDGAQLRVIGKGGKARTIPLHRELAVTLRAWLKSRPQDAPWLFPSRAAWRGCSGRLDKRRVSRVLATVYAPRAALPVAITPHSLRRSFATNLVRAGVPLPHVQQLLGHASLNTTRRYVRESPEELRASIERL
jgi:site-specific recombinase XerD